MADISQSAVVTQDPSEDIKIQGTENEEQLDSSLSSEVNETETETTETSQDAVENVVEEKPKRNLAAEAGKMSKLERERNETKAQSDKLLVQLDKVFSKNKDAYEQFRQTRIEEGLGDLGSYEQVYPSQDHLQTQSVGDNTQLGKGLDEQGAARIAEVTFRALEEEKEGFSEFIKAVPEMDPVNIKTPEEVEGAGVLYQNSKKLALEIMKYNRNLKFGQALVSAFNSLNPDREQTVVRTAVEAGKLIGQATANASNVGVTGSSTGSKITEDDSQLGEMDQEVMKKLGLDRDPGLKEAFLKHKKED